MQYHHLLLAYVRRAHALLAPRRRRGRPARGFVVHSALVASAAVVLAGPPVAGRALAQRPDTPVQTTRAPSGAPERVTRRQAIREALAHNPALQVSREQVAQARARVSQAVALPEPSVGIAAVGQQGALRPHTASETDLSVGVTLPFPGKFRLRGAVARGEMGSVDQLYALQRQQVVFQTNQAYDSLLVSLRHREDLEEARTLAQDFLKKTEARFNAGTTPKLDVVRAQVGVAQAENDLIANERGVANARAALNRLLGRPLDGPVDAADSLIVPDAAPDFARLEALAMASRPELRGLESERAGARAAGRLAQQYFLPDLSLSVSRNNVYGSPPIYSTGIGIGLPFFPWQHQRGEVAESRHRELELTAQYRDLASQVGQDLRNAYASATTTLRQVIYLRDQLLPTAREAYRIASVSYGLGGSSALEVIDAQRTLLDAKTQYASALAAVNDAMADLERATGSSLATDPSGANDDR